jgi:hypothetical protein
MNTVLKNLYLAVIKRRNIQPSSKFIKDNFFNLVVVILVVILLLNNCKSTSSGETGVKIIRDTTWITKDSTIYSKPQVIQTIPVNVYHDTTFREYLPDTNYSKLVLQYQDVVNQLLAQNIQSDSLKIDSIGYVHVLDTVQKNLVIGRSFKYNLKYPIIKETIIQPSLKVRQLYVGGQVSGVQGSPVNSINGGLLYKTKKDYIIGVNAGFDRNGNILYGIQSYWKIKLKN